MSRVIVNRPQALDDEHRQELLVLQKHFGERLRAVRHAKEMTLEQVAAGSGLHANYVGSVERGERNVSLYNIWRIGHSLGVEAHELMIALPKRSAC